MWLRLRCLLQTVLCSLVYAPLLDVLTLLTICAIIIYRHTHTHTHILSRWERLGPLLRSLLQVLTLPALLVRTYKC